MNNKELEALENYLFNEWKQNHINFGCDYKLEAELEKQLNNLKSVKQALQRLEAIDNANPSEALKSLEALEQDIKDRIILAEDRQIKLCEVIKHALIKAQEQEKALSIIKEKYVHIPQLLCAFENQLEEENPLEVYYNGQVGINVPMPLTEEEFDLLKRWLG